MVKMVDVSSFSNKSLVDLRGSKNFSLGDGWEVEVNKSLGDD